MPYMGKPTRSGGDLANSTQTAFKDRMKPNLWSYEAAALHYIIMHCEVVTPAKCCAYHGDVS